MNVLRNKRGIDTRALNLLLAIPIIVVSILFFYLFAGAQVGAGQMTYVDSSIALVNLDLDMAEFQRQNIFELTVASAGQITGLLKNYLAQKGYELVPNIMVSTTTMAAQSFVSTKCTGLDEVICEFTIKNKKIGQQRTYHREIFVAKPAGSIRKITLKGEIVE